MPWTWRVESPVGLKVPVKRVGAKVTVLKSGALSSSLAMRWSRMELPLLPLRASTTMEPVALPVAGSKVMSPCWMWKVPLDGVEGVGEGEVDFAAGGVEGELFGSAGRAGLRDGMRRRALRSRFREEVRMDDDREERLRLWSIAGRELLWGRQSR